MPPRACNQPFECSAFDFAHFARFRGAWRRRSILTPERLARLYSTASPTNSDGVGRLLQEATTHRCATRPEDIPFQSPVPEAKWARSVTTRHKRATAHEASAQPRPTRTHASALVARRRARRRAGRASALATAMRARQDLTKRKSGPAKPYPHRNFFTTCKVVLAIQQRVANLYNMATRALEPKPAGAGRITVDPLFCHISSDRDRLRKIMSTLSEHPVWRAL